MADWNPALYRRFESERTRPAIELLARVPLAEVRCAVDLGCGPGNSTELLAARYPQAEVVGIDSAAAMLVSARERLPGLRFERADVADWQPARAPDLIFANAVLQWVPGHKALFPRLFALLAPGGVLAVQMPDNMAEPSHVLMREVAANGPWAETLRDAARLPLPPVNTYYDALKPASQRVEIWHSVYNHVLAGPEAIVEWVKSTGLRPFIDPLSPSDREAFLARYLEKIAEAYPPTVDGKVLLRFPRLFIVAVR